MQHIGLVALAEADRVFQQVAVTEESVVVGLLEVPAAVTRLLTHSLGISVLLDGGLQRIDELLQDALQFELRGLAVRSGVDRADHGIESMVNTFDAPADGLLGDLPMLLAAKARLLQGVAFDLLDSTQSILHLVLVVLEGSHLRDLASDLLPSLAFGTFELRLGGGPSVAVVLNLLKTSGQGLSLRQPMLSFVMKLSDPGHVHRLVALEADCELRVALRLGLKVQPLQLVPSLPSILGILVEKVVSVSSHTTACENLLGNRVDVLQQRGFYLFSAPLLLVLSFRLEGVKALADVCEALVPGSETWVGGAAVRAQSGLLNFIPLLFLEVPGQLDTPSLYILALFVQTVE
mmetsp:Transcript_81700/g.170968  ORF Transcript_81700/g.170968 Transcript_81700/m.170968 type:complete len:348 (+) Transcript_81700:355-1398(+)